MAQSCVPRTIPSRWAWVDSWRLGGRFPLKLYAGVSDFAVEPSHVGATVLAYPSKGTSLDIPRIHRLTTEPEGPVPPPGGDHLPILRAYWTHCRQPPAPSSSRPQRPRSGCARHRRHRLGPCWASQIRADRRRRPMPIGYPIDARRAIPCGSMARSVSSRRQKWW